MKGRPAQSILVARFWAQVAVAGPDDCWLWKGHRSPGGYGIRYWNRRDQRAHRVAFELSGGVLPAGQILRHKCDVRHCCNPAHLEPGSHDDNMNDMKVRGRAARRRGPDNRQTKLSDDQVLMILVMRLAGRSVRDVGRVFGVCNQHVSRIANGVRRT